MMPIDCAHFDECQLDELLEQSWRSEEGLQRRLAVRLDQPALRTIVVLDFERSCTEEPPVIDDNVSAATRRTVRAVVA